MKWLALLLLAANVAVYWSGVSAPGADTRSARDINREAMHLVDEILAEARERRADAAVICYRIGPFTRNTELQLSIARIQRARIKAHRTVRDERREMRALRVYLGPFTSRAEAAPLMEWLRARGVDHYLSQTERGENGRRQDEQRGNLRVSLGYFTQDALAQQFVAHLLAQGADAKIGVEYRAIGPAQWLEAVAADGNALTDRPWPGNGALREIECGELPATMTARGEG